MNYEIIGPYGHKTFLKENLLAKCSTLEQTIGILSEMTSWLNNFNQSEDYLHLMEERKNFGKIISSEKFNELKTKRENFEKCLSGHIITSTSSRGIPYQGIKINDTIIPFGNYTTFIANPTKRRLSHHNILKNSFSVEGLNSFSNFLLLNDMQFHCYGKGQDSGKEWESKITFDIDLFGNFFLFNFDDMFYSELGLNKYRAFILK